MDPEILKELNESLRELNDTLSKQSSDLLDYSTAINNSTQTVNNNTNAVNSSNKATNAVTQGMTRYGQSNAAVDAENQRQNKLFAAALSSTKTAAIDFGKALVSADTSLTKYGDSARNLGSQAWEVGKNFGLVGMAIGGVLGGLGLAASSILTLNQNIVDFRDGFTKQAGVLPITADNLGKLASEAGFAYNRMPMLAKTVQNLGPSLMSLGGYAGEGAVRFMRIADVGEETRKRFSRMGLQQEDLLQYQSYYIELQRAGGQSAENKRKTDQQIQRESLLYAENLMILSGLTGEKADTIKDRQQTEMLKLEEQSAILAENEEIKRLRELGTAEANAKADEIAANQKLRKETIEYLAGQGREAEAFATGSVMRLGSYTDATAKYANVGLLQQAEALKRNRDIVGFTQNLTSTQMAMNERMNTATQFVSDAAEQMGGLGRDSLITVNKIGNDLRESTNRQREQMNAAGAEGTDPLADSAASIQELEILASQKFQAFLESIDPFRHGLDMFKDAAMIAAGVLGGGALIAGIAKLIGGRFGQLGTKGNPMYAKLDSGPGAPDTSSKGKGIGSRLKNIFRRSAAPAAAAAGVAPAAAAAAAGPLAGSATGAGALSSAAGGPGGTKVGIFLTGLATGLKAFSNPKILIGAGILSASIAVIGAAIAGATWMVGKTIPTLAAGLKSFDEVDGDKLSKIGKGMAGMAAGLLAIGGSKLTDAMGHLAQWASGDYSNPIDNLQDELTKFQNIDVDPVKIEHNSKAFIAFNKMLAEATEISGTIAGALSRAFGSFFEVEIPLDKFRSFSELEIDAEQAGKNATAFKLFSEAMASYKGFGTINALGVITSALAGSVFRLFTALPTDDPISRFEKFSGIQINGEQAKVNANAFKDFANAMAEYRGGPGVIDALSQLAGGALMSLFNTDGPIDAFRKFAQEDFGPNMERNTAALTTYANSNAAGNSAPSGGDAPASAAPAAPTASSPTPPPEPPGAGTATPESTGGETSTPAAPGATEGDTAAPASDSATSNSAAPTIEADKAALISHAQSLAPSARVGFYRALASQATQKVAEARASGNAAQARLYEQAANQFQLAAQIAESSTQTGTTTTSSGVRADIVTVGRDLQQRGLRVGEHPSFGGVSNVHRGRGHYEGRAIDINAVAGRDVDNPRAAATLDALKTELQGKGLTVLWRTTGHYGHMHAEVPRARAAYGGVFSESVGGESDAQKIGMLNPQSLISKLGKTAATIVPEITSAAPTESGTDLTPELLTMMERKLERVLYALENNQSTHERILKNSM
jgi:hypothetical protein